MIKFNFKAEWPLGNADIQWLNNYYFPSKFNEAVEQIQSVRAIDHKPFNPTSNGVMINGAEVNVLLKSDNWVSVNGGAAGQFFPNGTAGNEIVPDMWINWNRETDPSNNLFGRIVRHELIHMLLWLQYPPLDGDFVRYDNEWQNSQHGRSAPDKDIFILNINKLINSFFPQNHSSSPGNIPT